MMEEIKPHNSQACKKTSSHHRKRRDGAHQSMHKFTMPMLFKYNLVIQTVDLLRMILFRFDGLIWWLHHEWNSKILKKKRSGRLDVPIKMSFRHPQFQVGHTSITLDDWTMGLTHTEQGGTTNCTLQRPRFDKYSHVIICTCSWVNEIRASWFERLANLYPNIGHNVRYHRSLWLWACDIAGLIFLNKKKKLRPFLFYRY